MLRLVLAGVLAGLPLCVQAQVKGGLACPDGKVEAKSIGAYYVPAKSALTVFFFAEEMKDEEMDAILANAARFDAGDKAKGPGVGKRFKHVHPRSRGISTAPARSAFTSSGDSRDRHVAAGARSSR